MSEPSMTEADVLDVLSVATNMAMLGRGDNANSLLFEIRRVFVLLPNGRGWLKVCKSKTVSTERPSAMMNLIVYVGPYAEFRYDDLVPRVCEICPNENLREMEINRGERVVWVGPNRSGFGTQVSEVCQPTSFTNFEVKTATGSFATVFAEDLKKIENFCGYPPVIKWGVHVAYL